MGDIVTIEEFALAMPIEDMITNLLVCPQADCNVIHKFKKGFYIRELHMGAGTLAIGREQLSHHTNVFLKGKVLMLEDDGSKKVISAPMSFIGNPGRKTGLVLEDMVWQNIYETDETDIDVLEAMFFAREENFIEASAHRFAQESMGLEEERQDYELMLAELGYDPEDVEFESNITTDLCDLPDEEYKVRIGLSPIAGKGVIASANMIRGEIIGPTRIGIHRTPFGRYANHSSAPNAVMMEFMGNVFLIATRDIKGATGGFQGQEVTVDYRQVRQLQGELQ